MDTNSGTSESKTTGATAANTNSTLSQIAGEFSDALTSADTNVAQGVQALQQVHKARLSLLTRTAATLQAQYGADDPRVKAAQTAVTATTATVGTHRGCEPATGRCSAAGLRQRMGALWPRL